MWMGDLIFLSQTHYLQLHYIHVENILLRLIRTFLSTFNSEDECRFRYPAEP